MRILATHTGEDKRSTNHYLFGDVWELTFASLQAFSPRVIKTKVVWIDTEPSTIDNTTTHTAIPSYDTSTVTSTTNEPTGFNNGTTFGTRDWSFSWFRVVEGEVREEVVGTLLDFKDAVIVVPTLMIMFSVVTTLLLHAARPSDHRPRVLKI